MPVARKILLVDDSPLFLELEKSFFADLPYQILTAGSGGEGLEKAGRERPELILLDEEMPDLSGHQMLEKLRAVPGGRDTSVILVTGSADEAVIERCMRAGISDYIRKPFEPEDLLRKVAKALGLPERKAVSFLVRLRRGGVGTFARAVDLSQGGIRVETRELLDVGTSVDLEFFLPGTKTRIQSAATVVRRLAAAGDGRDRGYGLRFTGLPPEQRAQIDAAMRGR